MNTIQNNSRCCHLMKLNLILRAWNFSLCEKNEIELSFRLFSTLRCGKNEYLLAFVSVRINSRPETSAVLSVMLADDIFGFSRMLIRSSAVRTLNSSTSQKSICQKLLTATLITKRKDNHNWFSSQLQVRIPSARHKFFFYKKTARIVSQSLFNGVCRIFYFSNFHSDFAKK
jgi:hypothetical protein